MAADISSTHSDATRSLNRSHGSFELAFAPLLMALGGLWLDRTVGTVPLFTLGLAVFGIVGASLKVYFSYRHSMAELEETAPWAGHTRTAELRSASAGRASSERGSA